MVQVEGPTSARRSTDPAHAGGFVERFLDDNHTVGPRRMVQRLRILRSMLVKSAIERRADELIEPRRYGSAPLRVFRSPAGSSQRGERREHAPPVDPPRPPDLDSNDRGSSAELLIE